MLNLQTRTTVARCAGCRRLRDKANHWAIVAAYNRGSELAAIIIAQGERDLPENLALDVYDVCGSSCEQQVIRKLRENYVFDPNDEIAASAAPANPYVVEAEETMRKLYDSRGGRPRA